MVILVLLGLLLSLVYMYKQDVQIDTNSKWSTYDVDPYGFSFLYPSDSFFQNSDEELMQYIRVQDYDPYATSQTHDSRFSIEFFIFTNPEVLSQCRESVVNYEEQTVNGVTMYRGETKRDEMSGVGGGSIAVCIVRPNYDLYIQGMDYSAEDRVNQIIDSLRFGSQLRLPAPAVSIPNWYMHRRSDTNILYTRTEELPDIGATEGYAFGEQMYITVIPFAGATTRPEEWEQISWITDDVLLHETEWANLFDFTALRVRHEAGGASGEQLTFYLFAKDRVYNLSLYPVDEDNEQEFINMVYQYAEQLSEAY